MPFLSIDQSIHAARVVGVVFFAFAFLVSWRRIRG